MPTDYDVLVLGAGNAGLAAAGAARAAAQRVLVVEGRDVGGVIVKGIPASEIASRVYAYPTFHADLKFLV